jgi:hypothetical protein
VKTRLVLGALVASLVAAAALAPAGGAANECRGITRCVPVSGPWVVVRHGEPATYLLACPSGRGVVGGVDAVATKRTVRVSFVGRLGAPVSPGVTTSRSALFHAVLVTGRRQAFQPWLGCIPTAGGGGRSTVSARVPPGPALDLRARIVVVQPGAVKFGSVACPSGERLVGAWDAIAFRTKASPDLRAASRLEVSRAVAGKRVVLTVSASDGLSIDVHAVVQVGAKCAS